MIVLVCISLLSASCSKGSILVVSDPYIDIVEDSQWGPSSRLFVFQASLRGFRVDNAVADSRNRLSDILNKLESMPDYLVLSPWNSAFPANLTVPVKRIFVFDSFSNQPDQPDSTNSPLVTRILGERSSSLRESGKIAGRIAIKEGRPALAVITAGSDDGEPIIDGYREISGGEYPLEVLTFSEAQSQVIDEIARDIMRDASVLLLFAGPMNIPALEVGNEWNTPVITEYITESGAWSSRIVASIEDDTKKRDRVLLKSLASERAKDTEIYSMRLRNGKLFKK